MLAYEPLIAYRARFQNRPPDKELLVTAVLHENSPVCSYDPIHLDNLLAWAVMTEATQGQGLPDSNIAYEIPLPLRCAWRSDQGLPLWASSCFFPVGETAEDTVYRHKRAQSGRFSAAKSGRLSIKTTAGRWMERRVPVLATVVATSCWEARCEGDAEEVLRLLSYVSFLGKERGRGFGSVREWRVETLEGPQAPFYIRGGALSRPLPLAAVEVLEGLQPAGSVSPVGWTPPQWKPALFAPGWPVGTQVYSRTGPVSRSEAESEEIDFFANVPI